MRYPPVSIIILNFNGYQDTRKCLTSLMKTKYPKFHIYVADNGSKKNEAALLEKGYQNKKISFTRFDKNYGFTGGNNRILKKIKHRYIVLLNNDAIVSPNWLSPIIHKLEANKNVGIVQPKILWLRRKKYFDYAGACGGFIDKLGYPYTKGRIFHTLEEDKGQYDQASEIMWASGAAMAIRTSLFKKIGYLDEDYFNYMEEIDLCFRAAEAGYKIVCEPKSIVYHKVAATASRNDFKKRYWEHRNNILFVTKNFPLRKLLLILPIRLCMEYISVLYYLSIKRQDFALSVIVSQIYLLYGVPRTLLLRILKPKRRHKNIFTSIPLRSIVFAYFVQNKRQFWQLSDDLNTFTPKSLNFLKIQHLKATVAKST